MRKKDDIKKMISSLHEDYTSLMVKFSGLSSAVDRLHDMIKELIVVSSKLSLPIKVIKIVNDSFKCNICLCLPMKPPIIGTRCCNTLLGCSGCIDKWYSGVDSLTKACPNCREPKGYAPNLSI